ncbi:hypothetical protein MPLA_1270003 [Mesorhizobium sp. ORS 3359]|nr:hypothetical protein MPLA_1270003 [Mesorhizobium sp. ORS 3359]
MGGLTAVSHACRSEHDAENMLRFSDDIIFHFSNLGDGFRPIRPDVSGSKARRDPSDSLRALGL